MADYVWAITGQVAGYPAVAGEDVPTEIEAYPSRALQRLLDRGYIQFKAGGTDPAELDAKQDAATAATDAELAAAQSADDARLDALEAAPAGEASPFTDTGTIISSDDTQASWVVGSDRMDRDTADSTKNKRAFFNKVKGAFRAGSTSTNDWNDASLGTNSTAFGSNTTATAAESFACGNGSDAINTAAFASGFATSASGANSHAEGSITTASGTNSHAEGDTTYATGTNSHAEGTSSVAGNTSAHAEGSGTSASGNAAHAEGTSTTAGGQSAHAEGTSTSASGSSSHAEGEGTSATASYAHAEGYLSSASGAYSHAEGYQTLASGTGSLAGGSQSVASRFWQRARAGGRITANGDAQECDMVLWRITTNATPAILTSGTVKTASLGDPTVNVLTITAYRAYQLKISAVARRTDVQGEMAGFTWEGLVGRDASGSARIIGTPAEDKWNDVAAALWALGVSIDTTDATNNYVKVSATGELTKTIRWVAKMDWVEVAG